MKVLVVANDVITVVQFRMELLNTLVKCGHQLVVAIPSTSGIEAIEAIGCTVIDWPVTRHGTNPLVEVRAMVKLVQLMRRVDADAVLTYTLKPNLYVAAISLALRSTRQIATVTGLGGSVQESAGIGGRILFAVERLLLGQARTLFFQNAEDLRRFNGSAPPNGDQRLVRGSGVNLSEFSMAPYPGNEVVQFVVVTRLRRDKGITELTQCIEACEREGTHISISIVGPAEDPDLERQLKTLHTQGTCIYYGALKRPAVIDLIRKSDALLHPTYHEGMSNVILEASATGRPTLASDIPGCREAVIPGRTGLLFEPRSTASLLDAIHEFCRLPWVVRRQMGEAARHEVETKFDRNDVVTEYIAALNELD